MRDLHNNIKVLTALDAVLITTSGDDFDGDIIDMQGYDACEILVNCGTNAALSVGTVGFTLNIQHGDAANLSDAAFPAANEVLTEDAAAGPGGYTAYSAVDGTYATVDTTSIDDAVYKIGYVGNKRYVRIQCAVTGTITAGIAVGGAAVMSKALDLPAGA